jgi:hypothetical protein
VQKAIDEVKNEIQKKEDPVKDNVAPRTAERPTAGSEYRDAVKSSSEKPSNE